MSLVKTEIKQEEEPKYIFCQNCLKISPLTSESIIINYNFHTDTYIGFCLNILCNKKYYLG
jgi:hypothetical protein